jgi:YD repeat-containing protein
LTRPNGVNTDYTYDNLSRLLSILHKLNGNAIDGATYTVDNVGNRSTKLNHLNGITDTYTYDAIYQLTQVDQNPGGTPKAYAYDAVGNRLSDLTTANWTYNSSFHRKNVGAVSLAQISGYTVRRSSGFSELLQPPQLTFSLTPGQPVVFSMYSPRRRLLFSVNLTRSAPATPLLLQL